MVFGKVATLRRLSHSCLFLALSLILVQGGQAKDNKVKIILKADKGTSARYKGEATIHMEVQGQKILIESVDVDAVSYQEIDKAGNIHTEKKTESTSTTINGEKMPEDEKEMKEIVHEVYAPSGQLLSYETTDNDPEDENKDLTQRLANATNVIFSPNPVGVGDSWTSEIASNPKYGFRAAKATYTLQGFEDVNGVKCAKIKEVFHEANNEGLGSEATQWIELASGDTVKTDYKFTNLTIMSGGAKMVGTAEGHDTRLSGSPLQQTAAQKDADKKIEQAAKADENSIDTKVKDFEKLPGVFPLYRKVKDGRTQLLMELPESQLDKYVMLQATFASGVGDERAVAGDPISDQVLVFRKMPNGKIFLVVPNISFKANEDLPIKRAVDKSFSETYLESFNIEATSATRKSVLIDISTLFLGDIAGISQAFMPRSLAAMQLGGAMGPDREKTMITQLKNFPKNVFVQTAYSLMGGRGVGPSGTQADARGVVVKVDYSLYPLPMDDGYRPRYYDSRVGYFTTEYQDFSSDAKTNQIKQFILRWNLKKKDPTAKLSEPVEPITFWLDNAMPTEYRPAARTALLNWNKAFEGAGIKDAIVVKQMPDNADWDTADMSHNVVRWVVSPDNAYAVALFRANPLTGEILNANITVDAGMTKYVKSEFGFFVDPTRALSMFDEPKPPTADANSFRNRMRCGYAQEAMSNAAEGYLATMMLSKSVPGLNPTTYTEQFLHEVICHEMGHILGLRHNFAASTELTLDQLSDPKLVAEQGTSASVMDYLPYNLGALKGKGASFYSQTVGAYDLWAIQYGYDNVPNVRTSEGEKSFLTSLASDTNKPGHIYLSDEFADSIDPYVTRFDSSADPLDFWERTMQTSRFLLFKLGDYSPKDGSSFYDFTRNFDVLLGTYSRGAAQSTRFLGGVRKFPNYKGDANQKMPLQAVPAAQQRRALDLLNKSFFAEGSFAFPKSYYHMLTGDPADSGLGGAIAAVNDYPVLDTFARLQKSALKSVLSGSTLRRVYNQEFTAMEGTPVLRMADIFTSTTDTVWSELGSSKEYDPLRRLLQKADIDILISIMLGRQSAPEEAKSVAYGELTQLKARLTAAVPRAKGTYTPNHLRESLVRVSRALDARESLGGSAAAPQSLLDMLLGGEGTATKK